MTVIYGIHPIATALKSNPESLLKIYFLNNPLNPRLQMLLDTAKKLNISVDFLSKDNFQKKLPAEATHQGVYAEIQALEELTEHDLPSLIEASGQTAFFLVLDGVTDPHNLGACLRTANAAGVTAVIAPKDKAAGLTPVARKVACGAENYTPFIQVTNLARTLRLLKEAGIWVIGTDDEATQNIYATNLKGPLCIVMGAEGTGLRRLTRETCDILANIPMQGIISSLNVSAATAVCLFEAVRQRS